MRQLCASKSIRGPVPPINSLTFKWHPSPLPPAREPSPRAPGGLVVACLAEGPPLLEVPHHLLHPKGAPGERLRCAAASIAAAAASAGERLRCIAASIAAAPVGERLRCVAASIASTRGGRVARLRCLWL